MATNRYVTADSDGGDGSVGNPWTLAEAFANAAAGDVVNILSGSYSLGLTTISNAGTSAQLIRFRGYASTIGDLATQGRNANGTLNTTNFPDITLTGILTPTANTILENLSFAGALSSQLIGGTASDEFGIISCSVVNRQNNSAARAVLGDDNCYFINCDFECTGGGAGGAHSNVFESDIDTRISHCRFKGIASAFLCDTFGGPITDCVFVGNGTIKGLSISSASYKVYLINNTFYNCATAIQLLDGDMANVPILINNHVTDCSKYIDCLYAATANTAIIEVHNRTRDNTTPRTGTGDGAVIGEITTDTGGAATDYVDAGNGDFHLISGAAGINAALCGNGECGAHQRTPDYPAVTSVLSSDTVDGAAGTFVEADRNTDPGEENVEDGVTYKILNVSKEGTLVASGGGGRPEFRGSNL